MQWYFDWESKKFYEGAGALNGYRSDENVKGNNKKRKYFDQRLYGTGPSCGKSVGQKDTSSVVRIKSYRMNHLDNGLIIHDHYVDSVRIFAKCISGCRPFDMVDIMIMTQSS